jgi:type II restriction enzyme
MDFFSHLASYNDLITPYEETRAGFIALALEKNKKATPFVHEAKALKVLAAKAETPQELLEMREMENSLLTAAGVSDKAKKHLQEKDKKEAIDGLIKNFLEPAGKSFVDELIYRFLLTKGDALGGSMRNLAGMLGGWRFTRFFVSTGAVLGINFEYFDAKGKKWFDQDADDEMEKRAKAIYWISNGKNRMLIQNLTVPTVKKNIDICLLDCKQEEIFFEKSSSSNSAHQTAEKYLALGELKGGIDPAGADEHWKTANSALTRIRTAFASRNCFPKTFFIGAAIEKAMAAEIYHQLEMDTLSNAANLTNEQQTISLCHWLLTL